MQIFINIVFASIKVVSLYLNYNNDIGSSDEINKNSSVVVTLSESDISPVRWGL